jgi:1,4-alpha-glucan branching enzyme
MNKKLYRLMNWPEIESIVYSESDDPQGILGPHSAGSQTVYQTFIPGAVRVRIQPENTDKTYKMEMADESGFFAAVTSDAIDDYCYMAEFADGSVKKIPDPYRFASQIPGKVLEKFTNGDCENAYDYLGAHVKKVNGTEGTEFAVWAPNAVRVSTIGEFNGWDGRIHQMQRLGTSGIFEIFIPGVVSGAAYKFEIKVRGGALLIKADPYAFRQELRPGRSSIVCDVDSFSWDDGEWLRNRGNVQAGEVPVSIYELYPGSFSEPEVNGNEFINFRLLAGKLIPYLKECGYTHVELMPVMEHPLDASMGYETIGYYAPTARYGAPGDFQYFINELHREAIGVILDWTPAQFPADEYGLGNFDGSCLYENPDPRRGYLPAMGTKLFDYGRPQTAEYLMDNAIYWADKFHADGIRMDSVAIMLYLDYGKHDGEWAANIYGGNENLEAVSFIRKCNTVLHRKYAGILTIAEESAAWPKVTAAVDEDGLGFDYKWNNSGAADFMTYIGTDPYFRSGCHQKLTDIMLYCYSEKYISGFSHQEAIQQAGSLYDRMPGKRRDKLAGVRLSIAYLVAQPGKKLLFMGQDSAQTGIWNEKFRLDWKAYSKADVQRLHRFVCDINRVYRNDPAFYEQDDSPEGFEWINCITPDQCMVTFIRHGLDKSDFNVVAANFANTAQIFRIGVPEDGRYQVICDTDRKIYGGTGAMNEKSVRARSGEYDGKPFSISVSAGPLSVIILKYFAYDDREKSEIALEKAEEEKQAGDAAREEAVKLKSRQSEAEEKADEAEKNKLEARKKAEKARADLEKAKNRVIVIREQSDSDMAEARRAIEKAQKAAEKVRLDAEKRISLAQEAVEEAQGRIDQADELYKEEEENRNNASREAVEAAQKAALAEEKARTADERRIQFEDIAGIAVKKVSSVGRFAAGKVEDAGKFAAGKVEDVGRFAAEKVQNAGKKRK